MHLPWAKTFDEFKSLFDLLNGESKIIMPKRAFTIKYNKQARTQTTFTQKPSPAQKEKNGAEMICPFWTL